MTCDHHEGPTDIDDSKEANGHAAEIKVNDLPLFPVSPQEEGEGLPYAPINWPNPGDMWGWRVGKRTAISGYYLDRYLYLPSSLKKSSRCREAFASKLSVAQYIEATFPEADVNAFFASFSWKIPSRQAFLVKDHDSPISMSEEMTGQSLSESHESWPACKAGNRFCSSLIEQEEKASSMAISIMSCDICCAESTFCRDCCCILCCKSINLDAGSYSFIKCQAKDHDGLVCGHVAHLVCALRSYMAGTVGGAIGLDAEYCCRRCDARIPLVEHVRTILKSCESIVSRDNIKRMLKLAVCLLYGSQKKDAKELLCQVQSMLQKLECGAAFNNVWKVGEDKEVAMTGRREDEGLMNSGHSPEDPIVDYQNKSKKLEDQINEVLRDLRSAQQHEYKIAQERLIGQRDMLLHLYQELEKERSQLANCLPSDVPDGSKRTVVQREKQIQREEKKLEDMKKVAMGFGRTPRDILKQHFNFDVY